MPLFVILSDELDSSFTLSMQRQGPLVPNIRMPHSAKSIVSVDTFAVPVVPPFRPSVTTVCTMDVTESSTTITAPPQDRFSVNLVGGVLFVIF